MEKKTKESFFKVVGRYTGSKGYFLVLSLILSAISAICTIMPMYFVWRIIRALLLGGAGLSMSVLGFNVAAAVLFALAAIVLYFLSGIFSHLMAFEVERNIVFNSLRAVMSKPLGYFGRVESGRIRKVIMDGAAETHGFLAHQLPDLSGTLISPILILALFMMFDFRLGIAALCPLAVSMILMTQLTSPASIELRRKYYATLERISAEAVEYVRSIPVVKVFAQSVESFSRFYAAIVEYHSFAIKITMGWKNIMPAHEALAPATAFFVVPAALIIIASGGDPGAVVANSIMYILVGPTLGVLILRSSYVFSYFHKALISIQKIEEMIDFPELEYSPDAEIEAGSEGIEFRNVSFSYDKNEGSVLENISFKVNKGERVALVGPSGGGKTTIARLAARFWDVDDGEVLIDGINIKKYGKRDLMSRISFVFQNSSLFKKTIRENLMLARRDASEAELVDALKKASVYDVVSGLESGLDTMLGTKGTYLSGGEAQRIAIARAILKNAPIVLLDEATAFADPENEHAIQASFKELLQGKTTLMIAHRLSSVVDADRILVIDSGKIAEAGSHSELLAKGGIYSRMWDEYLKSIEWKLVG